ncbi:MAG: 30S ribosomal protein S17 [Patescibacteria group bacterium]|nr:30S ribosomal protein S17 [Patescibacteria group bacterium]MDD5295151.1 30S ribosomal protein S17 [Patescibacteria group bacterium]MDD5554911.1 30S ribosomal protein S17 [Patescibacteria group bacterium]
MKDDKKNQNTGNAGDLSPEKAVVGRKFSGIVVSDKMDKTIVVRIDRAKKNQKYGKRYIASKKYKVHDEKNHYKEGDKVVFVECRPVSKDKRWRVIYN